jgi:hypothetical protein
VPEQRSLRQAHPLRNGGGRDVTGILFRRQMDDRLDGGCPPFISREVFGTSIHGEPERK